MDWIKCVPFVGTAVSAGECIGAACRGEGKKALWKLGETLVDGAIDVATVASGGLAAVVTAPGKMAAKGVGKAVVGAAVKGVAGRAFVGAVASSVANSQSNESIPRSSASGRGNDDEEKRPKKKKSHEEEQEEEESPIVDYQLGPGGRTETLTARIRPRHLRRHTRTVRGYTDRVLRHVQSLDMCKVPSDWTQEDKQGDDQVGHIIGWKLGGPEDDLHNYFPQDPYFNRQMWDMVESEIYKFLSTASADSWVWIHFEFIYRKDTGNRPRGVKISWEFSDGTVDEKTFTNS